MLRASQGLSSDISPHKGKDLLRHGDIDVMAYSIETAGDAEDDSAMSVGSFESEEALQPSESIREKVEILEEMMVEDHLLLVDQEHKTSLAPNSIDYIVDPEAHEVQDTGTVLERAGVSHLVHGWIQQNQVKKVRTPRYFSLPDLFYLPLGTLYIRRYISLQHLDSVCDVLFFSDTCYINPMWCLSGSRVSRLERTLYARLSGRRDV